MPPDAVANLTVGEALQRRKKNSVPSVQAQMPVQDSQEE